MKTTFAGLITGFAIVSQATGGLTSSGNNLNCYGEVEVATAYYTCQTPYGISNKCADHRTIVRFEMNALTGNLEVGLSGKLSPVKLSTESDHSEFAAQVMKWAQSSHLSAYASYQNKLIETQLTADFGQAESAQSLDFSRGHRGSDQAAVFIPENFNASTRLNVSAIMFCMPSPIN
ncbi:MAG: hypothetical protein H7061_06435 [Bdellovibrionaceae bacterium]|nr:hypothetical protein [Bdellovibrio sp.]